MRQSKRFLIIGSTSFIGSNLIDHIKSEDFIATSKQYNLNKTFSFDLEKDSIEDFCKTYTFEFAIILIGETDPEICAKNKNKTYNLNVLKTKKLLLDLKKNKIKPIFFSSESIFDGNKRNYKESDEANSILEYGRQKLEIEDFIKEEFENYLIFRLSRVVSSSIYSNHLLINWLNSLIYHKKIDVAYDQFSSFIDIEDVIECILRSLKNNLNGVYHLGGGKSFSKEGLLNILKDSLDELFISKSIINKASIDDFKTIEKRPKNISLDSNLLYSELDYKPKTMKQCCKNLVIKWFNNNYDKEIIDLNSKIAYSRDINAKSLTWFSNFKTAFFNINIKKQLINNLKDKNLDTLRLCLHNNQNDKLHDMIISKKHHTYSRPKYHKEKSKTYTVLSGRIAIYIFDKKGNIIYNNVITKGEVFTIQSNLFHSDLPLSKTVLYKETTIGPLDKKDYYYATWAPNTEDHNDVKNYKKKLKKYTRKRK